jgi:hypothetical protein
MLISTYDTAWSVHMFSKAIRKIHGNRGSWLEMAMGTNPPGLGFSEPYPPKKNPPTGYLFSVTGRDFIPNPPG